MKGIILILALISCNCLKSQNQEYKDKLQLLVDLKQFLKNEIHLYLGTDFYETWDNKTTTNYLLYISSSQFVKSLNSHPFVYFGEDEKKAKLEKSKYDSLGYETLLYKTNNAISTKLSSSLLNFPSESILFIIIHEAVHQHLKGKSIPYIIEESSCDLIANYASIAFIEKYNTSLYKKAMKQKKMNEKFYKNINDAQRLADLELSPHKDKIFHSADKKLQNLIKRGNEFHKDRFNYDVNNAFFVRYENYTKHYFALKEKFLALQNFDSFIKYIEKMAERKPKIIDTIK